MGVENDHRDHHIAAIVRGFCVGQELVVVNGQEAQAVVGVQRAIVASNLVDAGNEGCKAAWVVMVPVTQLVLF